MKTTSKLLSVLLIVALCLSFGASAFADEGEEGAAASAEIIGAVGSVQTNVSEDNAADESDPAESTAVGHTGGAASEEDAVATITVGEDEILRYTSLESALADSKPGDTVVLASDVTVYGALHLPGVTLDLNGFVLNVVPTANREKAITGAAGSNLINGVVIAGVIVTETDEDGEETTSYESGDFSFTYVVCGDMSLDGTVIVNATGGAVLGGAAAENYAVGEGNALYALEKETEEEPEPAENAETSGEPESAADAETSGESEPAEGAESGDEAETAEKPEDAAAASEQTESADGTEADGESEAADEPEAVEKAEEEAPADAEEEDSVEIEVEDVESVENEALAKTVTVGGKKVADVSSGGKAYNAADADNANVIVLNKADSSFPNLTFSAPATVTGVAIDGVALNVPTEGSIQNKSVTVFGTTLSDLAAGYHVIYFTMKNVDYEGQVPVNVYPTVSYKPTKYYKGETDESIVFTVSDMPAAVTIDQDTSKKTPKSANNIAYTADNNKLTVTIVGTTLEAYDVGTHYIDLWYQMGSEFIRLRSTIEILVSYNIIKINDVNTEGDPNVKVDWYTNSGKVLKLTSDGPFDKLKSIQIDGRTINWTNYNCYSGGNSVVELLPSYLNTLAIGSHTVTLVYSDGEASASFEVHYGSSSPRTGDESNLALWICVLALSGAAVVVLIPKKKKQ